MNQGNNYHEVIVIGAGVAGIYQIKRLTDLGIDAIVLERDEDLDGTWYRNRYVSGSSSSTHLFQRYRLSHYLFCVIAIFL